MRFVSVKFVAVLLFSAVMIVGLGWVLPSLSGADSCGESKQVFSTSPIPPEELEYIVPLGNLNPPGHTFPTKHMYWHYADHDDDTVPKEIDVVAPADIEVTSISSLEDDSFTDYSVDFSACEEVNGYFIHLTTLDDKLVEAFDGPEDCQVMDHGEGEFKQCFMEVSVEFEEGERIGTVGGVESLTAMDFGLYDVRAEPAYVAAEERMSDEFGYVVCPIDYFPATTQDKLYQKIGNGRENRTQEPLCGTPHHDIAGTAQGVWFHAEESNGGDGTYNLALVPDNVDPSDLVISIGRALADTGIASGAFRFSPEDEGYINRRFADVSADGDTYCYEVFARHGTGAENRSLLLTMPEDGTLRLGVLPRRECGEGPWEFENGFVTFTR